MKGVGADHQEALGSEGRDNGSLAVVRIQDLCYHDDGDLDSEINMLQRSW